MVAVLRLVFLVAIAAQTQVNSTSLPQLSAFSAHMVDALILDGYSALSFRNHRDVQTSRTDPS